MDRTNISPQALSENRQALLLDIAAREFLRIGFSNCSIDHLSRASGVSKSTIYRHFSNKEELLRKVVTQLAEAHSQLVTDFTLDDKDPLISLRAFAEHIYTIESLPKNIEFLRLVIAEAGKLPSLSQLVRDYGTDHTLSTISNYFAKLISQGRMAHPDPNQAAVTFYTLARGNLRPLFGNISNHDEDLRRMHVDMDVFLKGCEILAPGE